MWKGGSAWLSDIVGAADRIAILLGEKHSVLERRQKAPYGGETDEAAAEPNGLKVFAKIPTPSLWLLRVPIRYSPSWPSLVLEANL